MMSNENKPHNQHGQVTRPTTNMANKLVDELKQNISNIHRGLVQDTDSITGEMPESAFVRYFLPRFFDPDSYQDNWVSQYIAIAGTPNRGVRIYKDGDHTKTTLYIAPPMFSSSRMTPHNQLSKTTKGSEIENVFAQAGMMAMNDSIGSEHMVNQYLEESMRRKKTTLDAAQEESAKVWINLYIRYGLIQPQQLQSQQQVDNNQVENSIDSLIDE